MKRIAFDVDQDLKTAIEKLAEERDLTVAQLMRRLCKEALRDTQKTLHL